MQPKNILPDEQFWEVIAKIDWSFEDDEDRMQPAINFLAAKSVSDIEGFQENLAYKLYQLDTEEHAKNIGEWAYKDEQTHFSVDSFLYVRCCVVANGKEFFDTVITNAKEMPKDLDFEALLYLADDAYELKTGEAFEYSTEYNYETYSNEDGWQ